MARYWFRRKRGGSAARPSTWQGWALASAMSCLTLGLVFLGPTIRDDASRALWVTLGIMLVILPVWILARFKTEGAS